MTNKVSIMSKYLMDVHAQGKCRPMKGKAGKTEGSSTFYGFKCNTTQHFLYLASDIKNIFGIALNSNCTFILN